CCACAVAGCRLEPTSPGSRAAAALLDHTPGRAPAFFSPWPPGKRIPPHRGPYRGVVRCHLGLAIPDPPDLCGISVGGEVAHWREGQTMFFDGGYEHFAWDGSDPTRAVLFLDLIRPLHGPAAAVNRSLLKAIGASPFLKDAQRRHEAWERRFDRLAK